jgi:hypothetical protein
VHLDEHVELVQPTTAFHRAKGPGTKFRFSRAPGDSRSPAAGDKITIPGSGVTVDASCKGSITVGCLKQLYNAVHYVPKCPKENAIALTGYSNEFASFADLQRFYADQVPQAINTSFDVELIGGACCSLSSLDTLVTTSTIMFWYKGGQNNQTRAGIEADLDVQFALGISFPTRGLFHSIGGSPPYIPDKDTLINTNEPYLTVCMQRPLYWFLSHGLSNLCRGASGWTSSLQKIKYPRPFQQVMVTTSKQVGSTLTFSHHSLAHHSVDLMQYLQTLPVAYAGILLNLVRPRPAVG